jgi:DNA-binding transcriptional LysR family regulator
VSIALQELDSAINTAQNDIIKITLNVGLFCVSNRFMGVLSDFMKQRPDIVFHIRHFQTASEYLDTDEYDLLLYPHGVLSPKYRGKLLFTEPYFLAVNKEVALAREKKIKLEMLKDYHLIFLRYGRANYDAAYYAYRNRGRSVTAAVLTNSHDVLRALVSRNAGVGFVAGDVSGVYKQDPNIILVPVDEEGFTNKVMIGFKREKHLSEAGKAFSEFISHAFSLS